VSGSRRTIDVAVLGLAVLATFVFASGVTTAEGADGPALKLRATVIGTGAPVAPLTIELFRWSTDEERAPLMAALLAPPPAPPAPAAGRGRAAGRGGRGGRAAGPPPSPIDRLTTAVKAAPTIGFIWSDGPTGYSMKYAWRIALPEGGERIVLVTDRRLGAHEPGWPAFAKAPADKPDAAGPAATADFTVIEMRLGAKGVGEAKASLSAPVVVDAAAKTLALDGYAAAPALLKVTR
jgi:hypothetical protein